MNISQYGNFTAPRVIGPIPFEIDRQGQWWYDFSRLPQANINLFIGVEASLTTVMAGLCTFGIFLLPNADVVDPNDLFNVIIPDVSCTIQRGFTGTTAFTGIDGTATIANPGIKRQVLLASMISFVGSGVALNTCRWRSLQLDVVGVSP